jgi:hypothetical protein
VSIRKPDGESFGRLNVQKDSDACAIAESAAYAVSAGERNPPETFLPLRPDWRSLCGTLRQWRCNGKHSYAGETMSIAMGLISLVGVAILLYARHRRLVTLGTQGYRPTPCIKGKGFNRVPSRGRYSRIPVRA